MCVFQTFETLNLNNIFLTLLFRNQVLKMEFMKYLFKGGGEM